MGMQHHSAKPNVVIILADDLGYGDIGFYGNPDLRTPHIDRLARDGVHLTQHYTCSPICAPARAGLLTGRYNHRTGALSVESNRGLDRMALREVTIADRLRSAGYATGMVGKWHNGLFDQRHHPNQRGFSEFAGFLNGGMDYYNWILDYNGRPRYSDGRYLTDVFSDEAVNFIERHAREPFFLYLAYNTPHSPLMAPEEDMAHYQSLAKFNPAVSTLYGMIQRMDAGIGRVLETLDRQGVTDNTIILFTSDNGPWLGTDRVAHQTFSMARYNGQFRGMKQDVLEGGIRVPAIVKWPAGLPQGKQVGEMIHFCDWAPTLARAAGVQTPPDLPWDGVDMLPVLSGELYDLNPKRFWQFNRYEPVPDCNAAMRDGDWKLYWPRIPEAMAKFPVDNLWYYGMYAVPHFETEIDRSPVYRTIPSTGKPELYHMLQDPYEQNDLAEIYPERVSRMKAELENWFEEVNHERRSLPEAWRGENFRQDSVRKP